jgi:polysaccharide biosynthesis/export protein
MKLFIYNKLPIIVCVYLLLCSCASRKDMAYLQDIDSKNSQETTLNYEIKFHPDDMLSIIVSAENPEVTNPFNLPEIQSNYSVENKQSGIKTYLIDKDGFINYPVLGKIHLADLTSLQANKKMIDLISVHIKNPIVNIKILNYKISLLGEVTKPGSYFIQSERISILEALSMAGDLTIYGIRSNIILIREKDGKKTYNRVNLTNSDFLESPFYYLVQNDIIIVEPNKTKMNSSKFGSEITTTISIASFLTTIAILLFKK